MDTTQSEDAPRQTAEKATRESARSPVWLVAPGLLLSGVTFVLGGFAALLVLLFFLPPLRRARMVAYGLFAGVVLVRLLMAAGVNPVLDYARQQVITRLETALGGEVSYGSTSGDVINGRIHFEDLAVELPELKGATSAGAVTIDTGWFLMFRTGGVHVSGSDLNVRVDAGEGRLEKWLANRGESFAGDFTFSFDTARVEVTGGTPAELTTGPVTGAGTAAGWEMRLALTQATVTFRERTHRFDIYGGMTLADAGDGLNVSCDFSAREPELGFGAVRGSLRPGTDSFILCTIDELKLKPLWERYRKVDEYGGRCYGHVKIGGELNALLIDLSLTLDEYSYFHTTAMGFDRDQSFRLPRGDVSGRIRLLNGSEILLDRVTLIADDATLATGKRMNARGRGMVQLSGPPGNLTGRLEAVVESGEINEGITWSREQTAGLEDVAPNLILVGEQFSNLTLDWELEVKALGVKAGILNGTIQGALAGTFDKREGTRVGKLRAEGELSMEDGEVNCLGLQGDFTGKLVFNPTAPTRHATLRGAVKGNLGDTVIDCEVTGSVSNPGFIFTGANMGPEELGRKIYRYSAEPMTDALELQRRNDCARIFGAYAASKQNPFEARSSGKVFFSFR